MNYEKLLTEIAQTKREVSQQRDTVTRGTIAEEKLLEEKKRILNSIHEDVGVPVFETEEAEKLYEEFGQSLEKLNQEAVKILREEGIRK